MEAFIRRLLSVANFFALVYCLRPTTECVFKGEWVWAVQALMFGLVLFVVFAILNTMVYWVFTGRWDFYFRKQSHLA